MNLSYALRSLLAPFHAGTTQPRMGMGIAIPMRGERFTVRRPQRMSDGYVSWPSRPALPPRICKVSDVSYNGACIEIDGEPPDAELWGCKSILFIASDNQEVQCGLIWQRGRSFGLHFESRPQPPSRTYA